MALVADVSRPADCASPPDPVQARWLCGALTRAAVVNGSAASVSQSDPAAGANAAGFYVLVDSRRCQRVGRCLWLANRVGRALGWLTLVRWNARAPPVLLGFVAGASGAVDAGGSCANPPLAPP